jgi:hypothetical protein
MSNQQKVITGLTPFPDKPAFYAYLSANETNATGAAATYTLGTQVAFTSRFDQASNLTSLNPVTFTAHQTGIYYFHMTVSFANITTASANRYLAVINGPSNDPQYFMSYAPTQTILGLTIEALLSLTTTQTVTFQAQISGQAGNTASINGSATEDRTYIGGFLVA